MRLTSKDWYATALVAAGVIVAIAWFVPVPGVGSLDVRVVAAAILAMGMVASVSAVVPGFSRLIHGSRGYLAGACALGLLASAAAVLTIVDGTESTLVVLVVAMVALWAGATVRHALDPVRTSAIRQP